MTYAVTLDFHNTIASCDSWFELEVRSLLARFLAWQAERNGRSIDDSIRDSAAETYRDIRRKVIETGLEMTAEDCIVEGLKRLGLHASSEDIRLGTAELMRDAMHDLAPIPGAIDLITTLRTAGVHLGIVSSAVYHPFLEWSLDSFGVRDAFTTVVTSASAGYYKSRTEIYDHALGTLQVNAEQAVHVGDSWRWDAGTAMKAGMKTVWFNPNGATSEVIPDLEIMSLHGAAPAILQLLGVSEGSAQWAP